ncbi:hypothetical protein [Microvirga yunnanensis]|uniref:hypothetical protein n=1 Tax=Microvirga yunnanensis TaxID=2953740 RepID=UPI0021C6DED3|nr:MULTISPECIES: hypothetical protein [unclassified Microvirga]
MTASLDQAPPHHLPALMRGGLVETIGGRVSVLTEPVPLPEEHTRKRLDEEIVCLQQVKTTLSS